ncbi:M20/M25/M40 family metallo-hydrolase [Actinomadura sp. BRA 177]|uniref:M20/M25/M40 family metallo-hydrolase n=1 Tax=Actinomadura sp. BRA 177 TaxID=2745202 RepID=UPI001C3E4F13|nr:M20/M25/M40 family metallo-hydrolase [Actinomadura sp. BRA 177]
MTLLADSTDQRNGTVVALFQPAEEASDGAQGMVDHGLADLIPKPDVALAQHVLSAPAGVLGTRSGPAFTTADSMRITRTDAAGTARCRRRRWTPWCSRR